MIPMPAKSFKRCSLRTSFVVILQTTTNLVFSYEILSDSDSREVYDRFGMEGLTKDAGPHMDAADAFAQFFEGGFSFGFAPGFGARRPGGQDSVVPNEVTLEDLYNGKSVKMNLEREVVCTQCKGYVVLSFPVSVVNVAQVWRPWKC